MDVKFVDTTFRDGSQSLWASGLRTGMMEAVMEEMDQIGFDVIEVPAAPLYFKKIVRDLKEDPWILAKMIAKKMPKTTKSCMTPPTIHPFEPAPRSIVKLFYRTIVNMGVLSRAQIVCNTMDQVKNVFPWYFPFLRELNMDIACGISYTISPRHTDEYYGEKTKEIAAYKPDVIYLKDQGGLLTVDSLRAILPSMIENANGIPVEIHSHCTTGLAESVYIEAAKLGVRIFHTGIPPLANGSAQPSVIQVARNLKLLGYKPNIDEALVQKVSERMIAMAKEDNMPIGAPLEYDYAQYLHQVPGGVISNLKYQLIEQKLENRIDEIMEESIQVRKDLGYPTMITPYSQFMVTQAAINVAQGERYKVVIDELILFAMGAFGEDSGYTWMDQNVRDRFLSLPRVKELSNRKDIADVPLKEIREKLGGPHLSDEELLLRYIMKGEQEIKAMRAAGPHKQYGTQFSSLVSLISQLKDQKKLYLHIKNKNNETLVLCKKGDKRDVRE